MVSCGRIFEWVGFCSTCGAKRKSAWLLHSREHLLSSVQDVEDPRSIQWTERQFWFTVAMMCVIFECSADTIRRRVETLVNTGDIDETQNYVSLTNVQAFGYNTTTLYNLNVQIVWACFFTDMQKSSWRSVAQWLYSDLYDASSPWRLTFVLASVRRIGIAIALKGKSFSPIITSSGFGRLFYQRSSLLDWSSVRVRL